jgi:hypothetical protein
MAGVQEDEQGAGGELILRGSGAGIGLVALPIAGLVLLILKIFSGQTWLRFDGNSGLSCCRLGWIGSDSSDSLLIRNSAWHFCPR